MSINSRISELIEVLGDNENSFAKRIAVSASVIFNVVNPKGRKSYPSGPVLDKILAIEQDGNRVSAEWLMRGEGNMFLGKGEYSKEDLDDINETIEELSQSVLKLQKDFAKFKTE